MSECLQCCYDDSECISASVCQLDLTKTSDFFGGSCSDLFERAYAHIMEDICSCLFAIELKNLADAANSLRSGLKDASDEVKWLLENMMRWSRIDAGAQICEQDPAVAFGDGKWYPGGIALADLQITLESNLTFRLEVTSSAKSTGDVLAGLTKRDARATNDESIAAFESGFEYILGKGLSPASIFVGLGYVSQCWFSEGDGSGPRPDTLAAGETSEMPHLRCEGEWLEFQCSAGVISAKHSSGSYFHWDTKIKKDETWQPTVAWSGSTASIRILRTRCSFFNDPLNSNSHQTKGASPTATYVAGRCVALHGQAQRKDPASHEIGAVHTPHKVCTKR